MSWHAQEANETNSYPKVEDVTMECFLNDQDIDLDPKMENVTIELFFISSWSHIQSESNNS